MKKDEMNGRVELEKGIREYISENYHRVYYSVSCEYFDSQTIAEELRQYLKDHPAEESFSDKINRIMAEKNLRPSDVYGKVDMDRRHFSKIRNDRFYQPSNRTAILFAFALELNLDETDDLLRSAKFSLSDSHQGDLVVRYFIEHKIYDLMLLNEMLDAFGFPLLLKCD